MTQQKPSHTIEQLLNRANDPAQNPADYPWLIGKLADALEREAMDRVHAEEALSRYGSPAQEEPASEFYEDVLEVKANIDTVGIISLKLPIRLADESGAPDVARAFNLAQNIVDAAMELAAEDEGEDEEPGMDFIPQGYVTHEELRGEAPKPLSHYTGVPDVDPLAVRWPQQWMEEPQDLPPIVMNFHYKREEGAIGQHFAELASGELIEIPNDSTFTFRPGPGLNIPV